MCIGIIILKLNKIVEEYNIIKEVFTFNLRKILRIKNITKIRFLIKFLEKIQE